MTGPNKTTRQLNSEPRVRFGSAALRQWMSLFAAEVHEAKPFLTELDSAIGDADHGINMCRGMSAVVETLDSLALGSLSGQLRVISMTLMSSVGGASGPLYGAFFLQSSQAALHKPELALADLSAAMEAGYRGVVQLGKASVGDKTMVDTLAAAVHSLRTSCSQHKTLPDALQACRRAARLAAEGTIPMVARKGRASYLGPRSAGTQDPGAASAALLFDSLADAVSPLSLSPHSAIPNPIPT
jgi:dihydroxyacetone kinase-like protein